jgi:CIC family chloride channel protein
LASENKLFLAAVGILFAKIIATSLSIGFGFYGGVFSPALLVGAAAGSAITAIVNHTGLYEFAGPELVICGMAAVAGAVVGAPLSMIIIVLELTGSYSLALTSTVGIATATVISGQLFGNSIFDKQLKQRKINISQGRLGLRLMEEEIKSIINSSALKFDSRTKASVALQTLIKEHQTEAYVVSDDNQYIGKLHLGSLFNAKNSDLVTTVIDHTAITIKSDASLQQAIEAAANFIGEAIPVVETESRNFLGTINEGDIFKLYLTLQGQTIDLEKR